MSQVVENSPANARGKRDDPWIKQMPWSGKRQLAPVFLLGKLYEQGAWGYRACWTTVQGVAKSWTRMSDKAQAQQTQLHSLISLQQRPWNYKVQYMFQSRDKNLNSD